MNTLPLTPDPVKRVTEFICNAMEHVIERITPALRDYEATEGVTDRRFANYTERDVQKLNGFSISNKVSYSIAHLANSRWLTNRISLLKLIDLTFENKALGEQVKEAIELLVCLCYAEKTENASIERFTFALREFTIRNGFFKRCDYCKHCIITDDRMFRTHTCKFGVASCPTFGECEGFVHRSTAGGDNK